jgi:hypothetical protein
MAADISLQKDYAVRRRDVFLSVTIGEGQQGRSSILLDDKEVLRTSPPIGRFLVGAGMDLVGRTLTIRTVANDVVAATNRLSVTYRLTGGLAAAEFTSRGKVDQDNEFLIFEAVFSFVAAGT